jgi:hypothetical protein
MRASLMNQDRFIGKRFRNLSHSIVNDLDTCKACTVLLRDSSADDESHQAHNLIQVPETRSAVEMVNDLKKIGV